MPFPFKNTNYRSKKHPVLEYIFFNKYDPANPQQSITFSLSEISDAYRMLGIREPASISNTILDLTRKKNPITCRLPQTIIDLGYDLRKKTGRTENFSYAGEFVFVGIGNQINSWVEWPDTYENIITIDSSFIPKGILPFLRNDEGAMFSVIDYCDILSIVFRQPSNTIIRIQNPLKWQPNEIDGFYYGCINGCPYLYPVEAKALTTDDDINVEQLSGALVSLCHKFSAITHYIKPLAIKMINNGLLLAEFDEVLSNCTEPTLHNLHIHKIVFSPVLENWR